MNWFLIISGFFAAFTAFGHLQKGMPWYLDLMLSASFDKVAKKVMQSVFHYVSVFLITSSVVLLAIGLEVGLGLEVVLVKFIAVNYFLFALVELYIASSANIEGGFIKMFHWIFFLLIAVFAWLGIS
jgi:hypothetical protein